MPTIEDMSDAIAELGAESIEVIRSKPAVFVTGRAFKSYRDVAAWQASTLYSTVGQLVQNGGNVYRLTQAGTSAGVGGPAGTGSAIVDNGARWAFHGTAAEVGNIRGTVVPLSGREIDRLPEGIRSRELRQVFTTSELKISADEQEADVLTIEGVRWEVQLVESWNRLAGYFRAVVAREGR